MPGSATIVFLATLYGAVHGRDAGDIGIGAIGSAISVRQSHPAVRQHQSVAPVQAPRGDGALQVLISEDYLPAPRHQRQ